MPLVGWSHYRALSEQADVHLVTQQRNREAIARAGLAEGKDFTVIDHESVVGPAYKLANLLGGRGGKGWTLRVAAYSLAYPFFERKLWKQLGGRIKAGEFDVVHQLTPLSPTSSPTMAKRCAKVGVPFLWGPINGGVPWPKAFDRERRKEREWLTKVRGITKLSPRYRSVRKHAAALLVGSGDTLRQMPDYALDRCLYLPENGIDPARFTARRTRKATDGKPLRLVFLGRLVPYKGCDMALAAAEPLLRSGRATFDVFGDGPEMAKLKTMTADWPGVTLHGNVPHAQLAERLAEMDLLVFPSIREFGGAVVLEAMAVGLPSLIVDYGGPGDLLSPETGWAVPMGDRAGIIAAVRNKLEAIDVDRAAIDHKGAAGITRVAGEFTWQAKASRTVEAYRWVLGKGPKPAWGDPEPHLAL